MKKYTKYKPSGVEWIGEIPEHWETIRLKFREKVIMGQSPNSEDVNTLQIGLPFLQGNAEFTNQSPIPKNWCANPNKIAEQDDILISVRAPVGAVNIANQNYGIGRGLCAIRPKTLLKQYLYYLALTINDELNSHATGSTFTAISVSSLSNIYIPTISLPEQSSIARFLDHKTALIDRITSNRRKQIYLLKEERKAVINKAVTKGINKNAKMKQSGVEWLGEIPEHWQVVRLKYIKSKKKNAFVDGPFGSNLKSEHIVENGDVYVVESGHITTGIFNYKESWKTITFEHFLTVNRSECVEEDIILAKIGANYGMSAILPSLDKPSVISGNSLKLTINKKHHDLNFIHYQLLNLKFNGAFELIVNLTAQPALSLTTMNSIELAIPPTKDEEILIVKYIEEKTSKIDALITKYEKQISLLEEYRTALISKAVTGQIDVREWQPETELELMS